MAKIVVHPGTPQAQVFELKPGDNYVGRGFANDLKIEDASVSSSHAQIIVAGSTVTIKDLGSTNGTYVNRSQVKEGLLRPGQSLQLGSVELAFEAGAEAVAPPAASPAAIPAAVPVAAAPPPLPAPARPVVRAVPPGPAAIPVTPAPAAPVVAVVPSTPAPGPVLKAAIPGSPASSSQAASAQATVPGATTSGPFDVPGLAEPPPGKTACKFHSNAAGQWLCAKCSELFCSLCVATKRTAEGPGFFCRRCGTACVPVRVNFKPQNDNEVKVYSDGALLGRSLGFGFAAMMISVGLWTGIAALTKTDVPFLYCIAIGFLCGYAVKIAAQDNPGVIFSGIATGFGLLGMVLGMVLGKLGMILVTHNTMLFAGGALVMFSVFFGMIIGLFLAWKFGGGDF